MPEPAQNKRRLLPEARQVWLAFSTILFLSYTWMILVFLFILPAWMNIIQAGELLVVFAYGCAAALLESLGLTAVLLAAAWILPRRWFFERFAIQAGATALWMAPWQLLLRARFIYWGTGTYAEVIPVLLILLVSLVYFNYLVYRFKSLGKFFWQLADRVTVFANLYAPLGIIGSIVVAWRNLF